jgi:hypothetical protein
MRLDVLAKCCSVWLSSILTVQQGGAIKAGASFAVRSVFTNLIVSGFMGLVTGTGFIVGVTGATVLTSWGVSALVLGTLFVGSTKWMTGTAPDLNMMQNVGPDMGVIGAILLLLSSEKVCQIFEPLVRRACNKHIKKMLQNALTSSIILTCVDVGVLLMRTQNPNFWPSYKKTRCELQLDKITHNQRIAGEQKFEEFRKEQSQNTKTVQTAIDTVFEIAETELKLEELLNTPILDKVKHDANVFELNGKIKELSEKHTLTLKNYDLSNKQLENLSKEVAQTHTPLNLHDLVAKYLEEVTKSLQTPGNIPRKELDNLYKQQSRLQVFLYKDKFDKYVLELSQSKSNKSIPDSEYRALTEKMNLSKSDLNDALAIAKALRKHSEGRSPVGPLRANNNPIVSTGFKHTDTLLKERFNQYEHFSKSDLEKKSKEKLNSLYAELTATAKAVGSNLTSSNQNAFRDKLAEWDDFLFQIGYGHP